MTPRYRTQGFVFKKEDRGEADRVFSVFTRDFGRVEIFAKSIRKMTSKLRGGIEIFSLSELSFVQGQHHKTLVDANKITVFDAIADSPQKSEIAHRASCLLDGFVKGQESDEKIWNLVIEFFGRVNDSPLRPVDYQLAYYHFFWNFISVLGYKPELAKCAMCARSLDANALYFSNKEGGVICQPCAFIDHGAKKVNADIVKVVRLFLGHDWHVIPKLKMESSSSTLLKAVSDEYGRYVAPSY